MACATLKRHLEFDPMHNSPSKRTKLAANRQCYSPPMQEAANLQHQGPTPVKHSPQAQSSASPFREVTSKLTPEKMAANIKEQAQRLHRLKHLQSNESAAVVNAPLALMGSTTGTGENPQAGDQKALFTYSQVGLICERMLREQEQRICEEYEKILSDKLAEQYDTFVKFTHDQIQKKFKAEACPSYLS